MTCHICAGDTCLGECMDCGRVSSDKCLVRGCENHKHQGRFVGDLCGPCYTMLSTGEISLYGGDTFIHKLSRELVACQDDLYMVSECGGAI